MRSLMECVCDVKGNELPRLVYVSREKRPGFDHHKKAGAMYTLINMKGLDGIQGPIYVGTGCVFLRQALYGFDSPPRRNPRKDLRTCCVVRRKGKSKKPSRGGGGKDEDILVLSQIVHLILVRSSHHAISYGMVYVGGIPHDASEKDPKDFCESVGKVTEVVAAAGGGRRPWRQHRVVATAFGH
ncbi:hypothetical protein IFM89_036931, partial [Coptis chinensis]